MRTYFYVASFGTPHFYFEGVGPHPQAAVDALVAGLDAHRRQYRLADPEWWREYAPNGITSDPADGWVREYVVGLAYRDGDVIR